MATVLLDGHLGDGLADVAVIVHHLRDVESQGAQLATMFDSGRHDRRRGERRVGGFEAKGLRELRQEQRHAVLELAGRDERPRPIRQLRPGPRNDGVTMRREKFVQHYGFFPGGAGFDGGLIAATFATTSSGTCSKYVPFLGGGLILRHAPTVAALTPYGSDPLPGIQPPAHIPHRSRLAPDRSWRRTYNESSRDATYTLTSRLFNVNVSVIEEPADEDLDQEAPDEFQGHAADRRSRKGETASTKRS